jgi:hypothetical protein
MSGISRRALLRGAAVSLAVPFLESWPFGRRAWAGPPRPPLRLLFVYVPNGVHMPHWTPEGLGYDWQTSPLLAPLAPYRKSLLVLTGLTLDGARPHGDGAGDHARAGASFLTCAHPRKTDGADIQAGVSVDQLAAQAIGDATPFPSLELGTEQSAQNGNCDSGYSCAYSSNIAWRSPSSPVAKEINPRLAFERLFLDGDGLTPDKRAQRDRFRASVLDAVRDDAKRARGKLGVADRKKLDEYLESVRALEKRLAPKPAPKQPISWNPPSGIPSEYGEHIRALHDVVTFAFQSDTTRVASIMCGNEGSNRSYRAIGVPEGHHDVSHHGKDKAKQEKIAKINLFHVEQLAYLLKQMSSVKESKGTLLDNSIVVFGSAISDGDEHNHENLPILVAGSGGGAIAGGRHVKLRRDTPLANLYLWILQRAGAKVARFGDSTEPLPGMMV